MINMREKWKKATALVKAITDEQVHDVEDLLKQGANVNARTEDGDTMLHVAVSQGCLNTEIVALLLKFGGDVKAKDYNGETPLQVAACQLEPEITELLLKHSGEVNANKSRGEYSPLHMAAMKNSKETVEVLLRNGADVNAKTKFGQTPLHFAACQTNPDIAKTLLIHYSDVNAKAHNGQTPLHVATIAGRKETAELLLRNGADICSEDENGRSPLSLAIAKGYRNISELFISHVVRQCTMGIRLEDKVLHSIRNDPDFEEYYYKCEKEINQLRSVRIFEQMTYYDILSNDWNYLSAYVKNDKLIHIMEDKEYYNIFPIYSSTLESQFENGILRKAVLDQSEEELEDFFITMGLPNQVVRRIFFYLSNKDLEYLRKAYGTVNVLDSTS